MLQVSLEKHSGLCQIFTDIEVALKIVTRCHEDEMTMRVAEAQLNYLPTSFPRIYHLHLALG